MHTIKLNDDELAMLCAVVSQKKTALFDAALDAHDKPEEECAFYWDRFHKFERLMDRLDDVRIADTSQDASDDEK